MAHKVQRYLLVQCFKIEYPVIYFCVYDHPIRVAEEDKKAISGKWFKFTITAIVVNYSGRGRRVHCNLK